MRNFVIVGTQRTGSSMLGEAIGLHPAVACGWEWTQRSPWTKKIILANNSLNGDFSGLFPHHREYMESILTTETNWLGFRRLFGASDKWIYHPRYSMTLLRDRFESHIKWFSEMPDMHIIHIIRGDNIDWLKSKFVASKAKAFIGRPYPDDMKVVIPISEAIARIKAKNWIDTRLGSLRESNPYVQILYEDILHDRVTMINKVLEFIHCDTMNLHIHEGKIQRQSTGVTRDYIANYKQLVDALSHLELLGDATYNNNRP